MAGLSNQQKRNKNHTLCLVFLCDLYIEINKINLIGVLMARPGAEKPIVKEWLRKWRTDEPSDLVVLNLPFLAKQANKKDREPTGSSLYHTADMVVAGKLFIGVAFIPNHHHAFVERWKDDQKRYLDFFEEVWVCTTTRNFTNTFNNTDKRIGIFIVNGTRTLAVVRYARSMPISEVGKRNISKLLKKSEITELYDDLGISYRKSHSKDKLLSNMHHVPYEVIKNTVTKSLKKRLAKKQFTKSSQ